MRRYIAKLGIGVVLLNSCLAYAQISQLPTDEIERRNAAVGFATAREASLFMLLGECSQLLSNSSISVENVARAWLARNQADMEATYSWIDAYLMHLKNTNQSAYRQVSLELPRATSNALIQTSRTFFARQIPTAATCESAIKTYALPQLDIQNIGKNPGYEAYAEFGQTLARIRAEPGFTVPPHMKLGFEKAPQSIASVGHIASLDAAEAAKERGDGPGRIAAFNGMAARGNGAAAQQIGIIYLNGQQVEKNPYLAYRWFYAAWSLSDMDGINAMGVMLRDGLGVQVDIPLAGASFYLAKAAARTRESFDRATSNLSRLEPQLTSDIKVHIACMTLGAVDEALRRPVHELGPLVQGRSIATPDRRLGTMIKELSDAAKSCSQ